MDDGIEIVMVQGRLSRRVAHPRKERQGDIQSPSDASMMSTTFSASVEVASEYHETDLDWRQRAGMR